MNSVFSTEPSGQKYVAAAQLPPHWGSEYAVPGP